MPYDILIIGGGPAGCSAARTARQRGLSAAVVSGRREDIPLSRSDRITNYPGCPDVSGRTLLETMHAQVLASGAELLPGHVSAVMLMGDTFGASGGADFWEARAVILCTGISAGKPFPGEAEHLGRGVSYCVTCDGGFYRDRIAALVGLTADAEEEAETLRRFGCRVLLFQDKKADYAVEGEERVTALRVNGKSFPCDGVFILRPGSAPEKLIPDLQMDGSHVLVDGRMATSVPGLFAAGDCTGTPYQIARAVGEGNLAALSAARWLDRKTKEEKA